jgi:DNA polymerase-1
MAVIEALIDADLIAYRCAATCESDSDSGVALLRCNDLTERIIDRVGATDFSLYLSGSGNFRKEIDPEYKAHRKDKPRPKWLQACREFLVSEWKAKVTDGIEADDAMGIAQREDTYICSLDKDMLQVPGMHYNWVRDEEAYVTEREGIKSFWTQMIVGDVADNVFGIRGLGPVKAARILDPIEGETHDDLEREYYNVVSGLYDDKVRLHSNACLLRILRSESEICLSKEDRIEAVLKRSSQPSLKQTNSKPVTKKTKSSTPSPVVNEPTTQTGQ